MRVVYICLILPSVIYASTDYTICPPTSWIPWRSSNQPYRLFTQDEYFSLTSGIFNSMFQSKAVKPRPISHLYTLENKTTIQGRQAVNGGQEIPIRYAPEDTRFWGNNSPAPTARITDDTSAGLTPEYLKDFLMFMKDRIPANKTVQDNVNSVFDLAVQNIRQLGDTARIEIQRIKERTGSDVSTSGIGDRWEAQVVRVVSEAAEDFKQQLTQQEQLFLQMFNLDTPPPLNAVQPNNTSEVSLGILNKVYTFVESCQNQLVQVWKVPKFWLDKNHWARKVCGNLIAGSTAFRELVGALIVLVNIANWFGRRPQSTNQQLLTLNIRIRTRGSKMPNGTPISDEPLVTRMDGDDIPEDFARRWINNDGRCKDNEASRGIKPSPGKRVARRDDVNDSSGLFTDYYDLHNVIWNLIWTTFLPAAENGKNAARYNVFRPGHGAENDIYKGGAATVELWLSNEPDIKNLKAPLTSDLASWKYQNDDPLKGQECYDVYLPSEARLSSGYNGTPTKHWMFAFADACKNVLGRSWAIPKDFEYSGKGYSASVGNKRRRGSQPPDPENGVGYHGYYHADGCQESLRCTDIVGNNGDGQKGDARNHFDACMGRTGDRWYHGGIFHHVARNGANCGWFEITPLAEEGPEVQTPWHSPELPNPILNLLSDQE